MRGRACLGDDDDEALACVGQRRAAFLAAFDLATVVVCLSARWRNCHLVAGLLWGETMTNNDSVGWKVAAPVEQWGDNIPDDRKARLRERLHVWRGQARTKDELGPFDGETLTGADVFWLAVLDVVGLDGDIVVAERALRELSYERPVFYAISKPLPLRGANLRGAKLAKAVLVQADLRDACLDWADLNQANLFSADLAHATLQGADLSRTNLERTNLHEADLTMAKLYDADLINAKMMGARLSHANLSEAALFDANLTGANLEKAILDGAHLDSAECIKADFHSASMAGSDMSYADLTGANFTEVDLSSAVMVQANLTNANVKNCNIYGISAWDVVTTGANQSNLCITPPDLDGVHKGDGILVDSLEVAQFLNLLLWNEKVRDIIDTITSKVVLILGRFSDEQKPLLDALREELRGEGYVPVMFDFVVPDSRDFTETITLLAKMARFIVADISEPSSIPKELEAIIPTLAVPVQPLRRRGARTYAMFSDNWKYDWVLAVYEYANEQEVRTTLREKVISPAEAKVLALGERRRASRA